MHVVATAGHVDHGKSTLVRALTGMEPDRWAEEQRRGMTIDLGFAWTSLPSGADVAFVDVPGHERFVTNMLAGVGPAPAVMLVVAADEGWQPQTDEHVRALDALGVRHGLLVVTKTDLADPAPIVADAVQRLEKTSLDPIAHVVVSAVAGTGVKELRQALGEMLASLPRPDDTAPVRLWIDRVFPVTGAGTVVTGTLAAGRLSIGDELVLSPVGKAVTVRALQSRKQPIDAVGGVSRVAVNIRGVDRDAIARGMALVTPGAWCVTDSVDVRTAAVDLTTHVVTHIGSAAVPTRVRRLGAGAVRLRLAEPRPLHVGDRLLLREPSGRTVVAVDIADVAPRPIRRRGDATRIAADLTVPKSAADEVCRRRAVTQAQLVEAGFVTPPTAAHRVGDWWIDPLQWSDWRERLAAVVPATAAGGRVGVPVDVVRRALGVPTADIVVALAAQRDDLEHVGGRLRRPGAPTFRDPRLDELGRRLSANPLDAPDGNEVRDLGRTVLAQGIEAGIIRNLGSGVFVGADAPAWAAALLADLPQPFTVSEAGQRLSSSRRVVVPLLEHLDAARVTRKQTDGRRVVVPPRG